MKIIDKCLFCGKKLTNASAEETTTGWHRKCVRHFFGTHRMPVLGLDEEKLKQLAQETVNQGLTVPGVQKKLSLHLAEEGEHSRLTIVDYPTGYILKPQTEDYDDLPEFEDLAMRLARLAGVRTVEHALMRQEYGYVYITRRIDRDIGPHETKMYAMEDFCQLSGRLTYDKYRGSYERCAKIIQAYSEIPGIDLSELFIRIVVSFVLGNSDMHLKNFSLIESEPGNRRFRLSEAYDILPVNLILPEDQEQLALTLNGKKRNIHRKDFMQFAKTAGIPEAAAKNILKLVVSLQGKFFEMIRMSCLKDENIEKMEQLVAERISIISGMR